MRLELDRELRERGIQLGELLLDGPPGVLEVRETNYCRVFAAADEHTGKVIAFGAIDNLWKGTSSQAVQNLNLMFGYPETRGLL